MAKTTTKRKFEGDLPTGKTKQSKTATSTKRDVSDSSEPENQSSDELFVQDQPVAAKHVKKSIPKSRKSEPARTSREDEYEEDPGRTESQQFLKLVEFESKKKKKAAKEQSEYLENFTYEVQREGHALKKQLWDGNQASIKKDTKFLGTFEAAYKLARPLDNPGEQRGFAAMYTQSQELTKGAIDLVAKFERITKQVSDLDTIALLDNAWGEEDEALTNLLSKGKAVGIDKCRNILMNSNVEAMDPEATDAANVLFPQVKNQVSSIWGKVARKEERAVQKLVKAITLEIA